MQGTTVPTMGVWEDWTKHTPPMLPPPTDVLQRQKFTNKAVSDLYLGPDLMPLVSSGSEWGADESSGFGAH